MTQETFIGAPLDVRAVQDVSDERAPLKTLKLETAKNSLDSLIENNLSGIIVLDHTGKIQLINSAAEHLMGRSRKQLIGHNFGFPTVAGETNELDFIRTRGGVVTAEVKTAETEWLGRPAYVLSMNDITDRKNLEIQRIQSVELFEQALESTIMAMGKALSQRDPYTFSHEVRVSDLSVAIAKELGFDDLFLQGLRLGGLVHDIGKMSIPAEILNKPGKLSKNEFELIKEHPVGGYDILCDVNFPWPISAVIRQHHERLDGSGYPDGLKGDQISIEAQILSVADVVEAINSHRPYRPALGIDLAMQVIKENRGTWFMPEAVDTCEELFKTERFEWT